MEEQKETHVVGQHSRSSKCMTVTGSHPSLFCFLPLIFRTSGLHLCIGII